jgi:hypothetical protein
MIFPIFPARKPLIVAVLGVLGILAAAWCLLQPEYWSFRPLPEGIKQGFPRSVELMLAREGVERDSTRLFVETSFDASAVQAVKERLGTHARRYLDTAGLQEMLYRVEIEKKQEGDATINFSSSSNRPRPKTGGADKQKLSDNVVATYWLNDAGKIVGETLQRKEIIPLVSAEDTVRAFERFLALLPKEYSRKENWRFDSTAAEQLVWSCALETSDLTRKEVWLTATKLSSSPEAWKIDWLYKVVFLEDDGALASEKESAAALREKSEADSASAGFKLGLQITFGILVAIGVLGLFVALADRIRRKAISYWLFVFALFTGASMASISISVVELPWYFGLVIFLVFTFTFGLFFIAIPLTTTMSLAQETFPDKFYTFSELRSFRFSSFHLGNMTLLGVSLGCVYAFFCTLLPYLGERIGSSGLANMSITQDSYMLAFPMRSGWPAFLQIPGNMFPTSLILSLLPPTLAFRFIKSKRLAVIVSLVALTFTLGLFNAVQESANSAILFKTTLNALLGFAALYFGDALALAAFVLAESFLLSAGLLPWSGMASPIAGASVGAMYAFGFWLYLRNQPESVSESDYKPHFVVQMEEEKRWNDEITAAKSVQEKLLPRSLPRRDSVVLSATCIPAYEVGGDYYDFFHLDDKRLGALIGDVSGKGISAAFYITLAKGVIVSQVREKGSPAEILHRVNELLYGVMERGKFVSMIYGIYDSDTREFTFANAGHNPLIVRRASGETVSVSAKGMAIGLNKGERFARAVSNATLKLEKDDCVLLYTDGVTEAMNIRRDEYGEERLLSVVAAAPPKADDIVSEALADVRSFVGKASQHDDITLVAMQVL